MLEGEAEARESRTSRTARLAVGRGILAGVMGIVVGVVLAARPPLAQAGVTGTVGVGALVGLGVFMTLFPWRSCRAVFVLARDLDSVAASIRAAARGRRDRTLEELLPSRNDALGPIVNAVRETLVHTRNSRRERLMIERTMDHSIQRATERATKRLRVEAVTDPLTGLGNRRVLDAALSSCLESPGAEARPITALAIDVDFFKVINDTLGHEAGDQCLAHLGHLLRSMIRGGDTAVRLGGDEFVVILPDTSGSSARGLAERLQELYRKMPWAHESLNRPTLSIGIATICTTEPDGSEKLMRRADEALYAVKRQGRDGVAA